MRRLFASIAVAGLAALVFGAGQAFAQDGAGDDQSVPDEVRDFVEDNIELFVGGLLAAILILLLIVMVLQRRAKERSEPKGPGPPPESSGPPAEPTRREARGRKREEKRRQREELREQRGQEARARKEEKARLRADASQERKDGPPSAEAEKPAPEVENQPPKNEEESVIAQNPDQPAKAGFFSAGIFGRQLGGGKEESASEKPAEANTAPGPPPSAVETTAPGPPPSAVETTVPGEPTVTPFAAPAAAGPPADQHLTAEIQTVEQRLQAQRAARERALADAQVRLREMEARAEAAERRIERAERLATMKAEEAEHERRLRQVLNEVEKAEQRALEAERRAATAERAAMEGASAAALSSTGEQQREASSEPTSTEPAPGPEAGTAAQGQLNVNAASFDDLRGLNLSVTQATRVLAYRERLGGYKSVDDLDDVPGFPENVLSDLKQRVTV